MSVSVPNVPDKQNRIQSPSYPIMPLGEAVEKIGKVDARFRSSAIERLDVARLLGYAGATGPSNMALASLASFGLLERTGKGEVRVTELARTILHYETPDELSDALREAAYLPPLYRELRERFPDIPVPPEEGVISFLNRRGFNSAAVRPAARAFLQTMRHLEKSGVTESSGHQTNRPGESPSHSKREEQTAMHIATPAQPHQGGTLPPSSNMSHVPSGELVLNEPNLDIRNGMVRVEALLDFEGLSQLEEQLQALKMLLKPRKVAPVTPSAAPQESDDADMENLLK